SKRDWSSDVCSSDLTLFGDDYQFTVGAESVPYTRSFTSFGAAAAEAGRSRIYGGIHYTFDNVNALAAGGEVAAYVVGGFLKPREIGRASCRERGGLW